MDADLAVILQVVRIESAAADAGIQAFAAPPLVDITLLQHAMPLAGASGIWGNSRAGMI